MLKFAKKAKKYLYKQKINEVKLGERNIKFTTENDFWDMAMIILASISHARVILMQEAEKNQLQTKLLRLDPLQNIYEQVKSGYFALWN